jgi:hypothetical protein
MLAFERAATTAFEDRTYAHLEKWFSHDCTLLSEDQRRHFITHGWQKAKSYNLTVECCVHSYMGCLERKTSLKMRAEQMAKYTWM